MTYRRRNHDWNAKLARRADELRAARQVVLHPWLFNCLSVLVRAVNLIRRTI